MRFLLWLILACVAFPVAVVVGLVWLMAVLVMLVVRLIALAFGLTVGAGVLSAMSLRRMRALRHRQEVERRPTVPGLTTAEVNDRRAALGLPPR